MYLQKNDYKIRIRTDLFNLLLEKITDDEDTTETEILQAANKIACDTIQVKLSVLYSTANEFEKTENERNGYLIALAISIALYEIYQRADDYEIPEKVIKNYDDAMEALDKIASGKSPIGLDPRDNTDPDNPGGPEDANIQGTGLRRMGSAPKRTHRI